MHHLRRRPNRDRLGAAIVFADHAAAFDRKRGIAVMMEAARESVRRLAERTFGIALGDGSSAMSVGAELLVHERPHRPQPFLRIDHGREWIEIRFNNAAASSAA